MSLFALFFLIVEMLGMGLSHEGRIAAIWNKALWDQVMRH